jgi:hypothetical protein
MNTAARFYRERSCNDDYAPVARFYSERSCNDDYVPVTRSTCEPNKLEQKYYENNTIIRQYTDANIKFGASTKGEFTLTQSFESDPRLEAIDAKLEADYKTETICMEMNLSEPEDEERPSFDDVGIRIEDLGLHYYHHITMSLFNSYDLANVVSKATISDDEENEP